MRYRKDLRIREEPPGHVSHFYVMSHARCLRERLLCVAESCTVGAKDSDALLGDRLEALWRASRETYGRPRLQSDLSMRKFM